MEKRIIVPALFGVLAVLFLGVYASVFLMLPVPFFVKLLIGAGVAAIAAAMVVVIIQRKREIQQEDKDDLSKY